MVLGVAVLKVKLRVMQALGGKEVIEEKLHLLILQVLSLALSCLRIATQRNVFAFDLSVLV
jgi:hypothetical protein